MKFKPLALALTLGILGAFYMLLVTYYPEITPYGESMRMLMEDTYPFYEVGSLGTELIGVLLGFLDGFVGGLVFAYLYNYMADKVCK